MYTLMQAEKAHFTIARMARLLEVSTSGYYSWVGAQDRNWDRLPPRSRARRVLDRAVRRIWVDSHKTYGYLRVHAQLLREGTRVNRKTVAASMRRQGLEGISPRRFRPVTTIPGTRTHSIPDRCERHWDTGVVDGVWVTDIVRREALSYPATVKGRRLVSVAAGT